MFLYWVLVVKNLPINAEDIRDVGSISGLEETLKEGMATHSNILVWRNPMDRGAWQVTIHRVAKGQTRLKRLNHTCTYWAHIC